MQRLFVAIRPPPVLRTWLLGLMGGVAAARWQDENRLHLTLRFIGEVDRHLARDVDAALAAIHHPSFEMAIDGLGAFERKGAASVIWAGATPPEPLRALHKKIDQALTCVGIEPDRRAFHPHITLARLPRGAGPIGSLIGGVGGASSPPFRVREFRLYESCLLPDGPTYGELERYSLG